MSLDYDDDTFGAYPDPNPQDEDARTAHQEEVDADFERAQADALDAEDDTSQKLYQFTLLKQDGTQEDLGTRHGDMPLAEMYKVLGCSTIELIPNDYYERKDVLLWGDEEGRFAQEVIDGEVQPKNHRNPQFKVLRDDVGNAWDVVGDILLQEEL
jgi:hypothetical protein